MPIDNENVPSLDWPTESVEPAPTPFAPDQMVRCDDCLRANPPTRVNCMYCGAILPQSDSNAALRQPTLRRLEKWERGYNNILLPTGANLDEPALAEAADLLRLTPENLSSILSAGKVLPLARASSLAEASLVQDRLLKFGITSAIMSEAENDSEAGGPVRVRSMEINHAGIEAYQTRETAPISFSWCDVILLVAGRIIIKRVELKEQKAKRAENSILDANEFVTDELVIDLYLQGDSPPLRVASNNFDFSCLGAGKGLMAADNITRLVQLIRVKAPQAEYDDSFNSVRKLLDLVWPPEQQNESSGWRRERPGKITLGSATELNNQNQFTRYSQLRRMIKASAVPRPERDSLVLEGNDGVA
ncbi:MAG TPA: hypothetical protein VLL54_09760 [Pyrinomonadaceae bacterium]|nr:hypothetical protein [Pyrinomonadaceae bacterium]